MRSYQCHKSVVCIVLNNDTLQRGAKPLRECVSWSPKPTSPKPILVLFSFSVLEVILIVNCRFISNNAEMGDTD